MIKNLILEQDITFKNVNIPNKITSKYIKKKLVELQEDIETPTIIVDDFKTSLSFIDRSVNKTLFKI